MNVNGYLGESFLAQEALYKKGMDVINAHPEGLYPLKVCVGKKCLENQQKKTISEVVKSQFDYHSLVRKRVEDSFHKIKDLISQKEQVKKKLDAYAHKEVQAKQKLSEKKIELINKYRKLDYGHHVVAIIFLFGFYAIYLACARAAIKIAFGKLNSETSDLEVKDKGLLDKISNFKGFEAFKTEYSSYQKRRELNESDLKSYRDLEGKLAKLDTDMKAGERFIPTDPKYYEGVLHVFCSGKKAQSQQPLLQRHIEACGLDVLMNVRQTYTLDEIVTEIVERYKNIQLGLISLESYVIDMDAVRKEAERVFQTLHIKSCYKVHFQDLTGLIKAVHLKASDLSKVTDLGFWESNTNRYARWKYAIGPLSGYKVDVEWSIFYLTRTLYDDNPNLFLEALKRSIAWYEMLVENSSDVRFFDDTGSSLPKKEVKEKAEAVLEKLKELNAGFKSTSKKMDSIADKFSQRNSQSPNHLAAFQRYLERFTCFIGKKASELRKNTGL